MKSTNRSLDNQHHRPFSSLKLFTASSFFKYLKHQPAAKSPNNRLHRRHHRQDAPKHSAPQPTTNIAGVDPARCRAISSKGRNAFDTFPKWAELPTELRDQIVSFAMFPTDTHFERSSLALSLVNRDLRELTSSRIYSRSTLRISSLRTYYHITRKLMQSSRNRYQSIEVTCQDTMDFAILDTIYSDIERGWFPNLQDFNINLSKLGKHFPISKAAATAQQMKSLAYDTLWCLIGPFLASIPNVRVNLGDMDVEKEKLL